MKINVTRKIKNYTVIVGILCLTILEAIALMNGINGTMFALVCTLIAGAVGVSIPTPNFMK